MCYCDDEENLSLNVDGFTRVDPLVITKTQNLLRCVSFFLHFSMCGLTDVSVALEQRDGFYLNSVYKTVSRSQWLDDLRHEPY
jgi:hypothetical protein